MGCSKGVLLFLGISCLCALAVAQPRPPAQMRPTLPTSCTGVTIEKNSTFNVGANSSKTILLWQGVVLLLCFGAFALFVTLIHRIVRTYIYYDSHLLDTFFDGGGDLNMGLVACSIVTKWAWTTNLGMATFMTVQFGIVGAFWYAAGACIQLFLFSIVAAEIRIKAPGAKTYLQVIYARFGAFPHIVMMLFAFACNILVSAMVLMEGVRLLNSLSNGLSNEVTTILIAIAIGFFTTVGGVGGYIYVSFFVCAFVFAVIMVFFSNVFYNPLMEDVDFGAVETMYKYIQCGQTQHSQDGSLITFLSQNGMIQGVVLILSSFGPIFVDQSFWQSAVAAKPGHSVFGFLTAGLAWFAFPFVGATTFGLAYWAYSIQGGAWPLETVEMEMQGYIPLWVSHQLMGNGGDFLMYTLIMMLVIMTGSSQVLSASSIIIYDIYQTYIAPFRPTPLPDDKQLSLRMQRAIKNEDYLEYDKRSVVWKYVVTVSVTCLLIPIELIFNEIGVEVPWLYQFTGLILGSCVLPIALAITWHRVTGPGVAAGTLGGLLGAIVAWLIYAAYQGNPDDKINGLAENFKLHSGMPMVMLTGTALAIGLGGLICIIVSLSCGGCDVNLLEEEEWEKTRRIDNPIVPWSVRYAPHLPASHMAKGRPHFYTVRRIFKGSEILAYILGVLLAVVIVLVWPACMLTINWDDLATKETMFNIWIMIALVWGIVATAYLIVVPILWEIIQTCCQAYYNRMWAHSERSGRPSMEEGPHEATMPHPIKHKPQQIRDDVTVSEYNASTLGASTMGRPESSLGTKGRGEDTQRWKTYIHLD